MNIPTEPVENTPRAPRKLGLSTTPEPMVSPAPPREVRKLELSQTPIAVPVRGVKPKTQTDILLEKAAGIEPSLQPHRLRGRIDTVLKMSLTDMLDWGNRNLEPLQKTSSQKARIASEISRIDASGWLTLTRDASCKQPSFFDRFSTKPPSYYEGMLNKTRAELLNFVKELETMKNDFFREITDLHLDAIAILVCGETFLDDNMKMTAQNRAKTLLASHQTAAMLQITIEQSMSQCASFIQQIDSLMSVTIPQWKVAFEKP